MPFLPFVLLVAWQAISRSASFALAWATALFFGQVPGNKGRILSIMALVSAAWVAVAVGFGLPLAIGFVLERAAVVPRNFDVATPQVWVLVAAMALTPPAIAALSEWGEFNGSRSLAGWLRKLPMSYPGTASLGAAVLQMVVVTPFLIADRVRRRRRLLQVSVVLEHTSPADLSKPVLEALRTLGRGGFRTTPLTGPISWPLRTSGLAVRHLLGRVVRGDPILLEGGDLRVIVYATNVAILGGEVEAYRARAAVERELAFGQAFLTWSPDSQALEEQLRRWYRAHRRDGAGRDGELDQLQGRIDAAPVASDEWNLLYRLRLQLEREAQDGNTVGPNGSPSARAEERHVVTATR